MQLSIFFEKSLISGILNEKHKNIASVCRNIPLNAFTFLLAFRRMGKHIDVQTILYNLVREPNFHILLGTKL